MAVNVFSTSSTTENLSRHEMLMWVNDTLQSQFSKVEELHTGAGYCLFMEILFPGVVPLKRVKWNSKNELDWLSNWKIVLNAFHDVQVDKQIQVERLIKGKFQDNFEFLQWFKKFFDANYDGHEYSPTEYRGGEPLPTDAKTPSAAMKRASNTSLNRSAPTAARTLPTRKPLAPSTTTYTPSRPVGKSAPATRPPPASLNNNGTHVTKLEKELEEARLQMADMDEAIVALEKERDFYFSKLRTIEVMCQDAEGEGLMDVQKLLNVLYETEEGFAVPAEDEVAQ